MLLRLVFLILSLSCSCGAWADVDTLLMPGEVIQGHVKLEEKCKECHVKFDQDAQDKLCMGCHKEVGADVQSHKGFHGRLEEKVCRTCHTDHKGRDAKIVIWDKEKFDHEKTDFPLAGAHQKQEKVKCKDCHDPKKKYSEAPLPCNDCHRKDDKHKNTLGADCGKCHNERDWKEAKFDHSKTKYELSGKHIDVKCKKCHADPSRYKEAPHDCLGCHRKDDKHKDQYGKKCEDCHTEKDWKKIEFIHDLKSTKYELLGKHKTTKCVSCHKGILYKDKTPTKCYACHRKDDVHKAGLGEKCESCHDEEKWKISKFDHDKDTKYSLLGKHITTKCEACHIPALKLPGQKEKIALTCNGCHKVDDKHKGEFGIKCESCHKEKDWKTIIFDHDKDTKYLLKGKHITTKCDACHTPALKLPGQKEKIATTCIGCHKIDDKHKSNFGAKCESCHKEKDWKTLIFDHDKDTKYPLKDKHIKVKCETCHKGKVYEEKLAKDCYSCHKKDDEKVHKFKLGKKCESCHDEKSWKEALFDHGLSRFPLLGLHIKVECKKCHLTQLYRDSPSDCFSCHKKDDADTHKRRLGKKCESCHNARSWKTWDFDHDKLTKFMLDGAHKKPNCYACHKKEVSDRFIVPRTCVGCHEDEDVHQGEFGQLCERCHVTRDFRTLLMGSGSQRR